MVAANMAGAVAQGRDQGTRRNNPAHQQASVILSGAQRQSKDASIGETVHPSTIRFADAQDDAVLGQFGAWPPASPG
jgi:hypothetical protein